MCLSWLWLEGVGVCSLVALLGSWQLVDTWGLAGAAECSPHVPNVGSMAWVFEGPLLHSADSMHGSQRGGLEGACVEQAGAVARLPLALC